MGGTPILHTHEERQAAIDGFVAEGRHPQWIAGWWRYQTRHQDDGPALDGTARSSQD
jgi:hypothetical protein